MLKQLIVGSLLALGILFALEAAASNNCGPINCTSPKVCCFSGIHPFTYRCINPGQFCPGNN